MSWKDTATNEAVMRSMDKPDYPFIQWINHPGDLRPAQDVGGWAMSVEQCEIARGAPLGSEVLKWKHPGGITESTTFTHSLTVAILVKRFAWVKKDGTRKIFVDKFIKGQGIFSWSHALCYIQSDDGRPIGPVLITLSGLVTTDFDNAYKEHARLVRRATGGTAAPPFFWVTLRAGETKPRGKTQQKADGTTLVIDTSVPFDADTAYVGDELAHKISDGWAEFDAWQNEWSEVEDGDTAEEAWSKDTKPATTTPAGYTQQRPPTVALRTEEPRFTVAKHKELIETLAARMGFEAPLSTADRTEKRMDIITALTACFDKEDASRAPLAVLEYLTGVAFISDVSDAQLRALHRWCAAELVDGEYQVSGAVVSEARAMYVVASVPL